MKKSVITIALLFVLIFTSGSMAEEADNGKEVFENRCAGICHKPPLPTALSPKQWKVALKTMQKRMDANGIKPLDKQESESLYGWLISQK